MPLTSFPLLTCFLLCMKHYEGIRRRWQNEKILFPLFKDFARTSESLIYPLKTTRLRTLLLLLYGTRANRARTWLLANSLMMTLTLFAIVSIVNGMNAVHLSTTISTYSRLHFCFYPCYEADAERPFAWYTVEQTKGSISLVHRSRGIATQIRGAKWRTTPYRTHLRMNRRVKYNCSLTRDGGMYWKRMMITRELRLGFAEVFN